MRMSVIYAINFYMQIYYASRCNRPVVVMEKAGSTYSAQAMSGRFSPQFSKKVTALQLNWFAKLNGLEAFVTYEAAKGRTKTETDDRKMSQFAAGIS